MTDNPFPTDMHREAHDAARACHVAAMEAVRLSLSAGWDPGAHDRITMLLDTADICRTVGDFLQRGSPRVLEVTRACAAICGDCRDECERSGVEDLRACAEACDRCASACARLSIQRTAD
jgi:hypothetical protein